MLSFPLIRCQAQRSVQSLKRYSVPWICVAAWAGAATLLVNNAQGQTNPVEVQAAAEQVAVRTVDGYKGIWFTLGQYYGPGEQPSEYSPRRTQPTFPYGDKYSGGLGTYTAKHRPLAVYAPAVDKTFFVYGGTPAEDERYLLCMIGVYDHAAHTLQKPVVVHDKQGVNDPHDNPSLLIDDKGHVWVFVSGRARSRMGFKYRSLQPYSIDGFEQISEEELTYPQPCLLEDGSLFHFFTKYTGVRELYFEHSQNGTTWTEDVKLAGIRQADDRQGGHYQVSQAIGNRVATFFNRHPQGNVDRRTDLYYVQSHDQGSSWSSIDGQSVAIPIEDVASPTRVVDYAAQGLNVYLKDMQFDSSGFPVVLYVTSRGHEPGPPNGPRHFRVTRWNGEAWVTTTICETDHNYDMGSLIIAETDWKIAIPNLAGPQPDHGGGEVMVWTSVDAGRTWTAERQVTSASRRNHNYVRVPLNFRDPFAFFWADGDPTQLSRSELYFTDSRGEQVWRLPYTMQSQTEAPERVR